MYGAPAVPQKIQLTVNQQVELRDRAAAAAQAEADSVLQIGLKNAAAVALHNFFEGVAMFFAVGGGGDARVGVALLLGVVVSYS